MGRGRRGGGREQARRHQLGHRCVNIRDVFVHEAAHTEPRAPAQQQAKQQALRRMREVPQHFGIASVEGRERMRIDIAGAVQHGKEVPPQGLAGRLQRIKSGVVVHAVGSSMVIGGARTVQHPMR